MVRRMLPEDAPAVREICAAALGHEASETLIARRIAELAADPAYYIAVCVSDTAHTVQGLIEAETYRLLYGGSGWNVIALAAAPEAQGQGVGRALLASLETLARERGDTFIRLNSRVERTEAHGFYAHLGYVCDKTQKRFIKTLGAE